MLYDFINSASEWGFGMFLVIFLVLVGIFLLWMRLTESPEEKKRRKEYKEQQYAKQAEAQRRLDEIAAKDRAQHKPKCPTCGSERFERIGELERYIDSTGFGTLAGGGLNSPSLGKTFKCNNCGYRW